MVVSMAMIVDCKAKQEKQLQTQTYFHTVVSNEVQHIQLFIQEILHSSKFKLPLFPCWRVNISHFPVSSSDILCSLGTWEFLHLQVLNLYLPNRSAGWEVWIISLQMCSVGQSSAACLIRAVTWWNATWVEYLWQRSKKAHVRLVTHGFLVWLEMY